MLEIKFKFNIRWWRGNDYDHVKKRLDIEVAKHHETYSEDMLQVCFQ